MASVEDSSVSEAVVAEELSPSTSSCFQGPQSFNDSGQHDSQVATIYFTVGDRHEIALVPTNSSSDEIKDMFRAAAEAGPCDIVKFYTQEGQLINISPNIPPNASSNPYRLEVVAVQHNSILMEQIGIDLFSFEKRVSSLERIYKQQSSPLKSIEGLKEDVNHLRQKLENFEHLSWLGFYKALHPPPLPDPIVEPVKPFRGHVYHKKSVAEKQKICDKFLLLSNVVPTQETRNLLREPGFDNWQWEDEEMLVLLQQMYLDLELLKKFDIEINILKNFLVRVYHHYNDVPFHNFRHCFCVTQMMFGMACYVNLPERIGELETLILLTSCICHDLDHPGYNNIYQINAQTELALRYNDISPLENHHCSIAFRILEDSECNIFRNLPHEMYKRVREGMIRAILATDMARHNEIVSQFRDIVPYFDKNNRTHVNLLTMVLIKVADISNEARPMDIAEPWLDCLFAEFFQQSDTEKLEGLPVTPFMDREKVTKPSSQCSFIGLVLLPLFEALGSLFTELDGMIIQPVRDALDYYRRLNEASQLAKHRKSTDASVLHSTISDKPPSESAKQFIRADSTVNASTGTLVGISEDVIPPDTTSSTPLPLQPRSSNPMSYRRASQLLMLKASGSSNSLKLSHLLRSASTTTGPSNLQSFPSLESEDSEREEQGELSDQEDPITEVAVSEKALKFKIATEPSFDFSTSRKGSRENKSESSGQSTTTPAPKDDRISYDLSIAALVPKVEMIPKLSVSATGSPAKLSSSEEVPSSSGKAKAKDSFLKRLKVFTDKLSISPADSASGGSTGSGGGSPSSSSLKSSQQSHQGFNVFRRQGKGKVKRQSTETATSSSGGKSSVSSKGRRHGKHRGSNSDPEGQTHFSRLPEPQESVVQSEERVGGEGEGNSSRLGSPEYSPALSGASGNKSYWKPCSGSLDSILSKDEPKRSPSRRLMSRLPPFFQRKSRLSFMNRSSSKNPDKNQS